MRARTHTHTLAFTVVWHLKASARCCFLQRMNHSSLPKGFKLLLVLEIIKLPNGSTETSKDTCWCFLTTAQLWPGFDHSRVPFRVE